MSAIELKLVDSIAWLTLNRPEKLNALTLPMHAELRDALQKVATSEAIRCLVITGAGRGFCAGQDLGDLELSALAEVMADNYNPLIRTITTMNMPVIACVNGVAAGAGANLALACDIVIAGESAQFIQSFSHLGLIPGAGGTWCMPRLVGMPRAMALAMTGESVAAQQACDWGMIWQCVADTELQHSTSALAMRLAQQPTTALAYTKQLLRLGWNRTLDEQLDLERDFQHAASQTNDFREGIDAFLHKRRANFTGK